MPRVTEMASICAGAALTLACGSAGTGPAPGTSTFVESSAPGSACTTFTGALCAYLMQCRGVPYCDLAHCLADNDCSGFPALGRALKAGAVAYDAGKGGACLARFATDPCGFGPLSPSPGVFDVLTRCPGSLTPRLARGAACVSSAECAAGTFCADAAVGCSGVCVPFATVGEGCGAGASCASGLTCDARAVCTPLAVADVEGAACGATPGSVTACASGLWCDATASDAQGACRAVGGVGAPCSALGGCQPSLHCAGVVAPATSGQCASPAFAGGGCELSSECAPGLVCDSGTCGAPFDVGIRCRSDGDCRAGLTCATEKCLDAKCPGDDCTDPNSWCVLGVCQSGLCRTRARTGAPCLSGGDCVSGTCAAGACAATDVCPP
jgi:hypothetical protein